ncbi:MAG: suppressor of fused domain protein [Myxococcota bacterium]
MSEGSRITRVKARAVDAEGVRALDAAMGRATGGPVQHLVDPRRTRRFVDGGPPLWSVAWSPCADGRGLLLATYGLSRAVDPAATFRHELSLRVTWAAGDMPPSGPPPWAYRLLAFLARRFLDAGAMSPGTFTLVGRPLAPESQMRSVALVSDPELPGVHRVVGVYADEALLGEAWSAEALLEALVAGESSWGATDLARRNAALDPAFVATMDAGAHREGSSTAAIDVAGVRWCAYDGGYAIEVAGGLGLRRVARMLRARLGFGRPLVIADGGRRIRFFPHDRIEAIATRSEQLDVGCARLDLMLFALETAACEPVPSPVTLRFRR